MSETDTNPTEQSSTETITNPAPYLKPATARDESVTSGMMIPAILLIVLVVVVVATFFEDEYNSLLAKVGLSDEDATSEVLTADTETATREPARTAATVNNTVTQYTDQATESVSMTPAANTLAEAKADDIETAAPATAPGPAKTYAPSAPAPYINPYYAYPDFDTPYQVYDYPDSKERQELIAKQRIIREQIEAQRRKDWEAMLEDRRQAWLEAETARREHLENMRNIRTAVLKRIEQDRADMDRRIQQMNEEMNTRREQSEKRMIESRKRSDRTEI
jgi:hypothetical protein